jgi:hypothetical protein
MATIVHQGKARNLTNSKVGETLAPDSTERQFVTFVNDVGGVHTIIADAETAFKDAEQFLAFFEHTRALAHVSASEGQPGHIAPADVLTQAAKAVGVEPAPAHDAAPAADQSQTGEGAF